MNYSNFLDPKPTVFPSILMQSPSQVPNENRFVHNFVLNSIPEEETIHSKSESMTNIPKTPNEKDTAVSAEGVLSVPKHPVKASLSGKNTIPMDKTLQEPKKRILRKLSQPLGAQLKNKTCFNIFHEWAQKTKMYKNETRKFVVPIAMAMENADYDFMCTDKTRRMDLKYVKNCLESLTEDQALLYIRGKKVLKTCQVVPKRPSEVEYEGGNLLQYYAVKWNYELPDNQYVVVGRNGNVYPISELFTIRVIVLNDTKKELEEQIGHELCTKCATKISSSSNNSVAVPSMITINVE